MKLADHMGGRTPLHIACDKDDGHEICNMRRSLAQGRARG